ncbi:hypothetical protein ACFPOE_07610 [Caenimonas terrae]|uniref:Uncharacterized protein n=1 Tax=Caenimonas terrae TaxID=696074 RepID=A0ABW0NBW9_9BURK
MKKAFGHLAAALMFGAVWPFVVGGPQGLPTLLRGAGQALAPGRDLATIVLLLVMAVAQCLAVVGLRALLRPLGRALVKAISPLLPLP